MGLELETRNISKAFRSTVANDRVSVSFSSGKIYAIVGENGAGKTTFFNILSGMYKPDQGEILIDGRKVHFGSPKDAIRRGIYLVQQNFSLVESFTVAENLAIVRGSGLNLLRLDRENPANRSESLEIDGRSLVKDLPMNFRQRLEIAKGLMYGANILLLDEPTSVLSPQQGEDLEKTLRGLAAEGKIVVITSHKLKEIARMSDHFIVMRRGRVVFSGSRDEIVSADELIDHMFEETLGALPVKRATVRNPLLEISNVSLIDRNRKLLVVDKAKLSVHSGEIVGLAGVAGNGQEELVRAIVGLREIQEGEIKLDGADITRWKTREIKKLGVGHIPEDGSLSGIVPDFTVAENLVLTSYDRDSSNLTNSKLVQDKARELVKEYGIMPPEIQLPSRLLSGGNLQRVILARELSRSDKLLISYNPTKGLDAKSKMFMQQRHLEKRNEGAGILLISEDLEEILSLSDQVAVIWKGRIFSLGEAERTNVFEIGRVMTSGK